MEMASVATVLLSLAALVLVVTIVPFTLTAIEYRQRDNGLAYLLLVLGVGTWNGMTVAQLLSPRPLVKGFFLALALVGALLAGLGWFLFASTASRTPSHFDRPTVYGFAAILVGADIVLAVTAPAHEVFWHLPSDAPVVEGFVTVVPAVGYWLHTGLLVGLFGGGSWLFAVAWLDGVTVRYSRAYAVGGTLVALALLGGPLLASSRPPLASLVAGVLTGTGWIQAKRGRVLRSVRPYLPTLGSNR